MYPGDLNMNDITLENFTEKTGRRFRVSRDQKQRIDNGELTREQAFQEFIDNGGLEKPQAQVQDIPDSVYLDPDLNLKNFSDKVEAAIGVRRRFRVTSEQKSRIDEGKLTREEALAEIVTAATAAHEEEPETVTTESN